MGPQDKGSLAHCLIPSLLKMENIGTCQEQIKRYLIHTTKNTQPAFGSVLINGGTKFKEIRMCHDWFRIDYFRLNLHLIIEILVHVCWSEFIIVRSLCWEVTRNNSIISNFVLSLIRIVYIFKSAMLVHHRIDESQLATNCIHNICPQW